MCSLKNGQHVPILGMFLVILSSSGSTMPTFWIMFFATGSHAVSGMMLLRNGSRTTLPFTTLVVFEIGKEKCFIAAVIDLRNINGTSHGIAVIIFAMF